MKKALTAIGLFLALTGCSNQTTKLPIATYHEIQTNLTSAIVDDIGPDAQIAKEKDNLIKNGQTFWLDEKKIVSNKEEMYPLQYLFVGNGISGVKAYKDNFPPTFKLGVCDNDGWCKIISPEIPKGLLAIGSKTTDYMEFYASKNGDFYTNVDTGDLGDANTLLDFYQNDKVLFSKKVVFGSDGGIWDRAMVNGSPSFTFRQASNIENTFYKGETMNEKYSVDDSENLFTVNGKIGFVATKNNKKFIMFDGKKVSQDFDEIRTHACCAISAYPFDTDQNGILSFLAKRGEKYYFVEINLK